MQPPGESVSDRLGAFLAAETLWIYCGVIAVFVLIELLLAPKGEPRAPSGKRHFVNFALLLLGAGLLALFPLGTAASALMAQDRQWGLFHAVEAHPALIVLSGLTAQTLVLYWLHRAMHAVPALWRIHRIHHADPALDLSTGLRHHPFEVLFTAPFHFGVVLALGLPLWAALLVDAILLAGALFKHLDARLPAPLERMAGWLLATPTIHSVHHSHHQPETDSNFGNLVIVWDRLFGTFAPPGAGVPRRIGLGDRYDGVANDFGWQLLIAFREPPHLPQEVVKNPKKGHP